MNAPVLTRKIDLRNYDKKFRFASVAYDDITASKFYKSLKVGDEIPEEDISKVCKYQMAAYLYRNENRLSPHFQQLRYVKKSKRNNGWSNRPRFSSQ